MAYFRSGIKIFSEISKIQGRGLLHSRSFSEDRTSTAKYHCQIRNESTKSTNNPPPSPEIIQNETKKSTSWFSFWNKTEAKAEEECKPLDQEPVSHETTFVYAMPVKALPGENVYISTLPGPIEKMLEQQKKHLHPKQANNTKNKTYSTDTDISTTSCDNPLTEQQKLFIQKLQTNSSTANEEIKTVETANHISSRNVTIEEQSDSQLNYHPISNRDTTSAYYSLKKTFNSSIGFSDAKENPTLSLKRSYSTFQVNSLQNHVINTNQPQPQDSAIRFYSSKKKKSGKKSKSKSGKKSKSKSGKKGKKQECKKVSSGLSAGKASPGCPSFKLGDCPPRARPDCTPEKVKLKPCTKLEAPFPSYSECTKDPTPKHRPTECPTDDKGPLPECIKENRGISIDGCNPPTPEKLTCPKPKKRAAPPKANKPCGEKVGKCDPSLKPHKNAGSSSSSPMKCTSATTITERVSEPSLTASRHFLPVRRCFSSSCKETRKPCFKNVGKAVKKKKIVLDSPVSCTSKQGKGGKCDHGTCKPATSFRPWKVCPKPTKTLNVPQCPKVVVNRSERRIPKKKHRCQKTMKVIKQCPKPTHSRKPNFQCRPKPTSKKSRKVVSRPPTPKRCSCGSSNAASSPHGLLAEKKKKCKKLKNAVEPDCKRDGGKRDTKCPRSQSKAKSKH